jgi:hypothetical protein
MSELLLRRLQMYEMRIETHTHQRVVAEDPRLLVLVALGVGTAGVDETKRRAC